MMTYNEFLENVLKLDKQAKNVAKAKFTTSGEVSRWAGHGAAASSIELRQVSWI